MSGKKYRFLFIQPFELPKTSKHADRYHSDELSKEKRMRTEYLNISHLLEDIEWDFHGGPIAPYGDWAVETREEMSKVGAMRLDIVRQACQSGKYNAIVMLGGGEPGFSEAREIGKHFNIPVSSCAFSQMHIATMLGRKFTVIDFTEVHNMLYSDLIVRHQMTDHCASIRNINFYHSRPGYEGSTIDQERDKYLRGEKSDALEVALAEAIDAIENDGAEVITFGCSDCFWLQQPLQKRLNEIGWDIPVLEGYTCAIELAKLYVDIGHGVSGLLYPSEMPKKIRRKKVF